MKILAIIVTYYPDRELLSENIKAILEKTDTLILLWDNTPQSNNSIVADFTDGIRVISCGSGENVGLPIAFNYAWHYANEHGFDYIMTMDQDSVWHDLSDFLNVVSANPVLSKSIVGPYNAEPKSGKTPLLLEQKQLITSGMLIPLDVVNACNGWPLTFKIDNVDFDFCYNCRYHGFKIFQIGKGWLEQNFGSKLHVKSFRKLGKEEGHINTYPPRRLFYIMRNGMIMKRKYVDFPLAFHLKYWLYYHARTIVLHEDKKIQKLLALLFGSIAGIFAKITY